MACRADSSRSSMISSAGLEPVQLAAQLGADGPAGAGDQDPLARRSAPATAAMSVCTGLRPSRSLIRGIADALDAGDAAEQLARSVGMTLGTSPHALGRGGQVAIAVPLGRAIAMTRTVAPVCAAACGHRGAVAEHRDAVDPQPPLGRVVVQERHRLVLGARAGGAGCAPAGRPPRRPRTR